MNCNHPIAQLRQGLNGFHCLKCKQKFSNESALRVMLGSLQFQDDEIRALKAHIRKRDHVRMCADCHKFVDTQSAYTIRVDGESISYCREHAPARIDSMRGLETWTESDEKAAAHYLLMNRYKSENCMLLLAKLDKDIVFEIYTKDCP